MDRKTPFMDGHELGGAGPLSRTFRKNFSESALLLKEAEELNFLAPQSCRYLFGDVVRLQLICASERNNPRCKPRPKTDRLL